MAIEVLVIGGGVRGAAMAYYLARAGAKVTLCERERLAAGPSGQDTALINASTKTPAAYTRLSALAAECHRALVAELDAPVEYEFLGNIPMVAFDAAGAARIRARAAELAEVEGVFAAVMDSRQLCALEPNASPEIVAALYAPDDGRVNARELTRALAAAAARYGAKVREGTPVEALEVAGGRVRRAKVGGRKVAVGDVVIAAGLETPRVAALAGVTVPLVPCRGQIVITAPQPPLIRRPLSVLQQDRAGRVYIGSGNQFVGFDTRVDARQAEAQLAYARRLVPALATAKVERVWVGLRPWPLDAQPILGPAPAVPNLWIATGHSGITLAALTGRALADWITRGKTDFPLAPFGLERFERAELAYAMEAYRKGLGTEGAD